MTDPTLVDLRKVSEAALKQELNKRLMLAHNIRFCLRTTQAGLVQTNVDMLLQFAPKHDRTSCSDDNLQTSDNCTRCNLLSAKKDGFALEAYLLEISYKHNPLPEAPDQIE